MVRLTLKIVLTSYDIMLAFAGAFSLLFLFNPHQYFYGFATFCFSVYSWYLWNNNTFNYAHRIILTVAKAVQRTNLPGATTKDVVVHIPIRQIRQFGYLYDYPATKRFVTKVAEFCAKTLNAETKLIDKTIVKYDKTRTDYVIMLISNE